MKPPRRRVHGLMVRALSTMLAVPRAGGLMKLRLMAAPGLTAFASVMLLRSKNFSNVITLIPWRASPDHPFSSASIDSEGKPCCGRQTACASTQQRPRLAVADGRVAITDPRHSLVRLVDPETLEETGTIAVEGRPFAIVAVGGSGASH